MQWCMPLTPAFREAETGGSLWAGARSTKWDQKSQGSTAKVVSKKKKKKGKKERREKMIRFFLAPSLTHSFQSVRNSYRSQLLPGILSYCLGFIFGDSNSEFLIYCNFYHFYFLFVLLFETGMHAAHQCLKSYLSSAGITGRTTTSRVSEYLLPQ